MNSTVRARKGLMVMIKEIATRDLRYDIGAEAGSDAVHKSPRYSYAVRIGIRRYSGTANRHSRIIANGSPR